LDVAAITSRPSGDIFRISFVGSSAGRSLSPETPASRLSY
jgi:hypothetical protein